MDNQLNLNIFKNKAEFKSKNRRITAKFLPVVPQLGVFSSSRVPTEFGDYGHESQDQKIAILNLNPQSFYLKSFIAGGLEIFKNYKRNWNESHGIKELQQICNQMQTLILESCRLSSGQTAETLSAIFGIWFLFGITVLQQPNGAPILYNLSEWVRQSFSEVLMADFEQVSSIPQPEHNVKFWNVLNSCVMRGHFEAAAKLIESVQEFRDDKRALSFCNFIESYPRLEGFATTLAFREAWHKWNEDVLFSFEGFESNSDPFDKMFANLYGILAGNEETIFENAASWQDTILALLFFKFPLHDIRRIKEVTSIVKSKITIINTLDQIHIALLEQDILVAISLCAQVDLWLVAHMVDILEKGNHLAGMIEDLELAPELSISEYYLLEFAETLVGNSSLWLEGLEYYQLCPTRGKKMLEEIILRVSCSPTRVEDIIKFCTVHELLDVKKELHRVLARNGLDAGDYISSIMHAIEAGDSMKIDYIVKILLLEYSKSGDRKFIQIAESLPSAALFKSTPLAFLERYCEFQTLYLNGEYQAAADLLVKLFVSGTVPKYFWKTLLLDCLPLLEGELCVFKYDQVLELMRITEICTISDFVENYNNGKDLENQEDPFVILKLALSRSLAAALVFQN